MTGRKRPDHAIELQHKVGFQECDPLGVVWHGRYLEWFEAARTELFCSVALDVPAIRRMGYLMFVAESRCRYMTPLRYGDAAVVWAWFGELSPLIHVHYDVHQKDTGRWCARAKTVLAVTGRNGALLGEVPAPMLERPPGR